MRAIQGLSSACRPKANMSKSVSLRTRSRPVTADRPGTIDCISCSIRGRKAASRGSKRCCRSQMQVRMATSAQQHVGSDAQQGKAKVVGMGLACWDYLAQVAQFPQPDEKIRTLQLQVWSTGDPRSHKQSFFYYCKCNELHLSFVDTRWRECGQLLDCCISPRR